MTSPNVVRVVTRGSSLALTQTTQLVEILKKLNPECEFEILTLTTTGDKVTDRPLSQFRGIGVFVKELEKALSAGEADLAVHSLKDVPVERVDGLVLAAFPARKEPFDVLLTKANMRFGDLQHGAVIGTSSPRRLVQLRHARPDLSFKDLRGNVDTRIRKLEDGLYDGIIAAAAGLRRLGLTYHEKSVLPMDLCLPAAGQGCLAIECRESDELSCRVAKTVDDGPTRMEIAAEREFLKEVGGGCQTPIAVYSKIERESLTLSGVIGDPDSTELVRDSITAPVSGCEGVGTVLAARMIDLCVKNHIRIIR
jgi:hydroxymethylbilane synthase